MRSTETPFALVSSVGAGVLRSEGCWLPPSPPSRINASTVRSRSPFRLFSTVAFRLSSENPISLSVDSLTSNPSPVPGTLDPNTLDGLFVLGGDGSRDPLEGRAEDVERRPIPAFLVGLGGGGGGRSSAELVLPVFCLVPTPEPAMYILCSYFCLIYLSIAPSISSTSIGMEGFTFLGLYCRLDSTLPVRFMFCPKISLSFGWMEVGSHRLDRYSNYPCSKT